MRIPTLAIHLDREVNTSGFKPNLEQHLAPVLATNIKVRAPTSSHIIYCVYCIYIYTDYA
jgi:aspartyl aminopeptidase